MTLIIIICGLQLNYDKIMINILNKECDFEIANFNYKEIHNTVVNKYCLFQDQTQVCLFFPVINSYISFIEIKNLIKNQ